MFSMSLSTCSTFSDFAFFIGNFDTLGFSASRNSPFSNLILVESKTSCSKTPLLFASPNALSAVNFATDSM